MKGSTAAHYVMIRIVGSVDLEDWPAQLRDG